MTELKERSDITDTSVLSKIVTEYFDKFLQKNNIKISSKDIDLKINGVNYSRDFSNINLVGNYNSDYLSVKGSLLSNKQNLNVDLSIKKDKDLFVNKIKLDSLAFKFNINFDLDINNKIVIGKTDLNIINPNIFVRTIFHPESVLFKRIIDNYNIDINSKFEFKNNIFSLYELSINGNSIRGNGDIKIDINDNSKNIVNLDLLFMNFDNLIIKDMSGVLNNWANENNISIFFDEEQEESLNKNIYIGSIEKLLKINPTEFNIKIDNLQFNQHDILNTNIKCIYDFNNKKTLYFKEFSSEFPYETNVSIEDESDINIIKVKGKNINEFINFLKNSKNTAKQKKVVNSDINTDNTETDNTNGNFEFNGKLKISNDKLIITDGIFESDIFNSKNKLEIKFDSGVSYFAVDTIIDDLDLEKFINNFVSLNSNNNIIQSLKAKTLFLNKFNLITYLKFTINNIKYKDFQDKNYQFIIRTSRGMFDLYKVNLDNKVAGGFFINILNQNPTINANLSLYNFELTKNIDLNNLLFQIPTFDGFFGEINVQGKDVKFKNSKIEKFNFSANINNGVITTNAFDISGFGGECHISGFLNLLFLRKLNLTFSKCTGSLSEILYLFTKKNNINGVIGFSSILYAEGSTLENFINSYIVNVKIIGNSIIIKDFGLQKLSSDLFEINNNETLLQNIKPEDILFNSNNQTVFENLSSSTIRYSRRDGGNFDFILSTPLANGRIIGDFNFFNGDMSLKDTNASFTILGGTVQKTIPLTIIMALSGKTHDLKIVPNLIQINSYINSVKEQYNIIKKQYEEKHKKEKEIEEDMMDKDKDEDEEEQDMF